MRIDLCHELLQLRSIWKYFVILLATGSRRPLWFPTEGAAPAAGLAIDAVRRLSLHKDITLTHKKHSAAPDTLMRERHGVLLCGLLVGWWVHITGACCTSFPVGREGLFND